MRISREQMFMDVAFVVAKRSTCCRLNVGAVAVHNNRIVSIGYNGRPAGYPHCELNECSGYGSGCSLAIHAEINALRHCQCELPIDAMYITDSPCGQCARLLSANVRNVYFSRPYRDTSPVAHLVNSGINVYRVHSAGYIIDMKTDEVREL